MGFNYYLIDRQHINSQVKALWEDLNLDLDLSNIAYHLCKRSNGKHTFDKCMFRPDKILWDTIRDMNVNEINEDDVWKHLSNPKYAIITEMFDEISLTSFKEEFYEGNNTVEFSPYINFC